MPPATITTSRPSARSTGQPLTERPAKADLGARIRAVTAGGGPAARMVRQRIGRRTRETEIGTGENPGCSTMTNCPAAPPIRRRVDPSVDEAFRVLVSPSQRADRVRGRHVETDRGGGCRSRWSTGRAALTAVQWPPAPRGRRSPPGTRSCSGRSRRIPRCQTGRARSRTCGSAIAGSGRSLRPEVAARDLGKAPLKQESQLAMGHVDGAVQVGLSWSRCRSRWGRPSCSCAGQASIGHVDPSWMSSWSIAGRADRPWRPRHRHGGPGGCHAAGGGDLNRGRPRSGESRHQPIAIRQPASITKPSSSSVSTRSWPRAPRDRSPSTRRSRC